MIGLIVANAAALLAGYRPALEKGAPSTGLSKHLRVEEGAGCLPYNHQQILPTQEGFLRLVVLG
jgi:hypothetical protein